MAIVVVYDGETEGQAWERTTRWAAERKTLLGYEGGTFIVRGRKCVDSVHRGNVPQFRRSSVTVGTANGRHREEIKRDRSSLLRARAMRESRDFPEAFRLMQKYGVA